jgi:PucR C-terminal helix-turn-helix domain
MTNKSGGTMTRTGGPDLLLPAQVAARMRTALPTVAADILAAIVRDVPGYADPFGGTMGRTIEAAVQLALHGFLDLAAEPAGADASTPGDPPRQGAYALGRGEARSGRSMESLLAAYRLGARVAWRELSVVAVDGGLAADTLARFAELVFAYIDELSASSAAGHADELASSGLVRQRHLERLSHSLLTGDSPPALEAAAARADWPAPRSLTAVILPEARARGALTLLDARTLRPVDDVPGLESGDHTVLLVPDADAAARAPLLHSLRARQAVVGPPRQWQRVRTSYLRALRALELDAHRLRADPDPGWPIDTEQMLVELVLGSDAEAVADLRAHVLAPLADLRPAAAEKLTLTLRSWLLHHGRREDIAAELFVHPQTVRYRMGQLRELYGDRLDSPQTVLEMTIALGVPARPGG